MRGECHPLTADQGHARSTDRPAERQAGNLGRHRGGVDGHHVVQILGVKRHHRDDHLDFVAQTLHEGRAQRTVDETTGEDGVFAGPTFTTEERTGDSTGRVHALFDVNGEGEEVELILGVLAGGGGRQQHGAFVEVRHGRTGGLTGQAAGLKADGARAE